MGRHFWRSSSPKPLLKTGSYSRFFRTTSRCVVTVLRNGDSQISFLCLTTLMLKKSYFLCLSRVFCILLSAHFLLLLTPKKNLALLPFPAGINYPAGNLYDPVIPPPQPSLHGLSSPSSLSLSPSGRGSSPFRAPGWARWSYSCGWKDTCSRELDLGKP